MLKNTPSEHPQFGFFDLIQQLDLNHGLLALANAFNWQELETAFSELYSHTGRGAKPIRLMTGLLILKQLYNLSDDAVIEQWRMTPYFQAFCGETTFQTTQPCVSSQLSIFRKRIGTQGVERIFALSVELHGKAAEEKTVLVDTTVQEKNITYPTDTKLAIKIINRLNKLAKQHGIKQRRTFVKEIKALRLKSRHFRHPKVKGKARRALKRLRTIAGILHRELQRKLPAQALKEQEERFTLYQRVLNQSPKDKNKIYSLHEPDVYCVGKGKDHKPYEYGSKASVVSTLKSKIIIGVVSHDVHVHDSKTLEPALTHAHQHRETPIDLAVVDRGYRGAQQYVDTEVLLPKPPLKRDSEYQRQKKRTLCQKRAGIEPIIGHLKQDFRLSKCRLKGTDGDQINLLMAACAWNLRKWMAAFFLFKFRGVLFGICWIVDLAQPQFDEEVKIIAILFVVHKQDR